MTDANDNLCALSSNGNTRRSVPTCSGAVIPVGSWVVREAKSASWSEADLPPNLSRDSGGGIGSSGLSLLVGLDDKVDGHMESEAKEDALPPMGGSSATLFDLDSDLD